ncbi:MAG: Gfo/Idh/MocA family oxidoreductase, partial [Gammaproteobacteria bacterium]
MTEPLTVAIIGARTVRQGTGPWFAKHFAAAGANVCALLGSSPDSAEQARQELAERFDIQAMAYSNWDDLLESSDPDLIAIATPADTHREFLWKAHTANKPVFVEKPFVWDSARNNHADV